jgi:predicted nucleotidyltransferase
MDVTPYVEAIRRHTAALVRRNQQAQAEARRDLSKLVEVLRADPRVKRAYLFGSLAKNAFHPAADIDLAVEGLDEAQQIELQERLQSCTRFRVDLRDLNGTPEFRGLVEFYGELLDAKPR